MLLPSPLYFIHNPRSREGKRATAVHALQQTIDSRYPWVETSAPGEAIHLAYAAALNGADTVVAVGGDGTVHEVICGLMMIPKERRPKLGILPIGTGNDFAFAANIPLDLSEALDRVLRGQTMHVDIGSIEDDRGTRSFWANTAGVGFDSKVVIRSRSLRFIRGKALYLASTLLTLLLEHEMMEVELMIDHRRFAEKILMLTLGNGPREGGGFYTTPHSRINDGQFEMLLVKPLSRILMLNLLPKVIKGSHLNSHSVWHSPFTSLTLASKQPLVIHCDGEIFSVASDHVKRIEVEMHREALRVIF